MMAITLITEDDLHLVISNLLQVKDQVQGSKMMPHKLRLFPRSQSLDSKAAAQITAALITADAKVEKMKWMECQLELCTPPL